MLSCVPVARSYCSYRIVHRARAECSWISCVSTDRELSRASGGVVVHREPRPRPGPGHEKPMKNKRKPTKNQAKPQTKTKKNVIFHYFLLSERPAASCRRPPNPLRTGEYTCMAEKVEGRREVRLEDAQLLGVVLACLYCISLLHIFIA